ncbi:FAD-binding oxidoreductase [Candidatus Microgenomates bacterium]|nr:FAD-binding oxidoreductase [Candidatus Microgenomates bacterium]
MSKLVDYLQQHLDGEVLEDADVLNYFSTDGSIFKIRPRIIIYPKDTTDVRKSVRFSWQLAEQGQRLPVTVRGKGTDQAGAAIGEGAMMVMPAHFNRLVGFAKTDVVVEPGMLFGDLQRTLKSHGRFLPPYPSSMEFSTVGGAVANNACGEKSLKYGCTRDFVVSLDVVLANGQLIRAEKISAKELNRKKGQADFEGEVYRQLDGLLEDNEALIRQAKTQLTVSKNSAGYDLWDVKGKDGSFDLTKLLVGSQGTLGVVTSITFATAPYNPKTHLVAAFIDDLEKVGQVVSQLAKLKPSAMEVVDYYLLDFLRRSQPRALEKVVDGELPKLMVLIEFDDHQEFQRKRHAKKANEILAKAGIPTRIVIKKDEQERFWQIRRSAAAVLWQDKGKKKALPIIEDGVVPIANLPEFLHRVYDLFSAHHLEIAVWGHAGNANLHLQPFLDLSNVGDRQLVFKLMDEFYKMVIDLGGSTCGEHNDGRLRAPYLVDVYGPEIHRLFEEVKKILDPHNILNPSVKLNFTKDEMMPILRDEYSMKHLYDHIPHLS